MRELAGFDPLRYRDVLRWPLREALLALEEKRRAEALERWRFEVGVWATFASMGSKKKAPALPAILKR